MIEVPAFGPCAETIARDGRACVCCSAPIAGRPFGIVRRSRHGGDSPANLLTFLGAGADPLDPDDHRARVESGIDPSDKAKGYEIATGQNPTLVPVMLFTSPGSSITAWLDDAGGYLFAPPGEEAAA